MPHADDGDSLYRLIRILLLALLVGFIWKVRNQFFQVSFSSDTVNGHYFHHAAVQLTIPDIAGREGLDFQCRD